MDIIELTRALGAEIQKDPVYTAFHAAKKKNDADKQLGALIDKVQAIHLDYQHEATSQNPDEKKLAEFDKAFTAAYRQVMANPNMQEFEKAKAELDVLMRRITGILSLCAQGEDPATCEYTPSCSGDCSACSSDCGK